MRIVYYIQSYRNLTVFRPNKLSVIQAVEMLRCRAQNKLTV